METVKGFVRDFVYHSQETQYSVLHLIPEAQETEIVCTGVTPGLEPGECLEAEGEYIEHAVYGKQFKISQYRIVTPTDAVSAERYLASGAIKGIGVALAVRIVSHFGEETFHIIEHEPERLSEVKGISKNKAREIGEQTAGKRELREAMVFLSEFGISNTLALKIYDEYGIRMYSVIKENPYRLADDIDGLGFVKADEIASKIGIRTDSDFRIGSGIIYVLNQCVSEGHVYLPKEELTARTAELLGVDSEAVLHLYPNLAMDKKIVIRRKDEEEQIYLSALFFTEMKSAAMLSEIAENASDTGVYTDEKKLKEEVASIAAELGIELDSLQSQAVETCIKSGVFILSGGPGTGKTTTINVMLAYFDKHGMTFMLAAPTGRAAKRMTEATGYEAKTIHRLLEINGVSGTDGKNANFQRNEENPLEADAIIIDEMSMVDIFLFYALLSAVGRGTKLVLIGDVRQLPSVGAGRILADIMDSGCFPTIVLEKIFRQSGCSDIVVNAHKIDKGEMIELDNKGKDFFFLERDNAQKIYEHMLTLMIKKLPSYVKCNPFDIQVLTPMRKGLLGVERLNEILQTYLNPESPRKKEFHVGERMFRVGDKVMQMKNNYQIEWEILGNYQIPIDHGTGVFNGECGIIDEIDESLRTITVEYDEKRIVTYSYQEAEDLELAYAITIHKSQGSEYPAVLMPLLTGPKMLMNRNLLYTGVTRAVKCLTILGSRETLMEMIRNENEQERFTGFSDRIRERYL